MMDEDWDLLLSFFPKNWEELAKRSGALKGLRKDKSAANLLRTLLMHVACGYSLRETATRAFEAELASVSDVGLMKRLRKSKEWLHAMCVALFRQRGVEIGGAPGPELRLVDSTTVREPGKTGSLWRIHYSVRVPSLRCDFFRITGTEGAGTGESLARFPMSRGDRILADRGYSKAPGLRYAASQGAFVCVRLNPSSLPVVDEKKERPFGLRKRLKALGRPGQVGCWPARLPDPEGAGLPIRLCAIRKSEAATELARKKLRRRAARHGNALRRQTIFLAAYVVLVTTLPPAAFPPEAVLGSYRIRWQIELVFKRFKQICQLGHLPKHDEESAKAWLYGKLLVALVTQNIIHCAESFSPWGYDLRDLQPMA
jgi:hypothetical protein